MRPEPSKADAISALEAALYNYRNGKVGPYTLAIISQGDLAILDERNLELKTQNGQLAGYLSTAEDRASRYRDTLEEIANRGCQAHAIKHLLPSDRQCTCLSCIAAQALR